MSLSDELPPLDDFIDSDTDGALEGIDDEPDDFDPLTLLSQPIFADIDDADLDINIEKSSCDLGSIDSLPQLPDDEDPPTNLMLDEPTYPPRQHSETPTPSGVGRGFDAYTSPTPTPTLSSEPPQLHYPPGTGGMVGGSQHAPPPRDDAIKSDLHIELQSVDYQVQDVQRSILQVQQQIEQVQLNASTFSSPPQHKQQSIQDQMDIQTLMNSAGLNRSPPGRSISMPIRRNQMQGGPLNHPPFMMQKPMSQVMEQSTTMGNAQESTGLNHFSNHATSNNNTTTTTTPGTTNSSSNVSTTNSMDSPSINLTLIQQQQSMMGVSQGSSHSRGSRNLPTPTGGGMNMNQLQMGGSPLTSPGGNSLGMMQKSLMDRQRGVMNSPDSHYSHSSPSHSTIQQQGRNRMQNIMGQGINQPFSVDESSESMATATTTKTPNAMGNSNTMQMMNNMHGMNHQGFGGMDTSTNPNMMNNMSMMNNMNNMNNMGNMNNMVNMNNMSSLGNMNNMNNMGNMNNMNNMGNMNNMNNMGNMNNMNNMSTMNSMSSFNQGFNAGNSDGSPMNNMPMFNNLGDASGGSMPNDMSSMGMNPNMMMMMQQQQMMNFRDGGDVAQRQNSMTSTTSASLNMMSNQGQELLSPGAGGGGDFDLSQMPISFQAQQMGLGQANGGLSMERLVEKMQRSALSRNLVKQMSGSSVPMNPTGRSVGRSLSGRGIARTNSKTGRTLSRANSGRSVQRTASGRQLEGGELPVRRLAQDSKHRMKDLGGLSNSVHRGVVRHKSQSAAMGSNNNKVVNIDGEDVGLF